MIDVWNRVLTRLKQGSADICTEYTSTEQDTPSRFPAVCVKQLNNSDTAVDLENNENAVLSEIEIQSYSNKSQTEARKIMSLQCDIMRGLGYDRTSGPLPVANAASPGIHRMTARFRRTVCVGEEEYM